MNIIKMLALLVIMSGTIAPDFAQARPLSGTELTSRSVRSINNALYRAGAQCFVALQAKSGTHTDTYKCGNRAKARKAAGKLTSKFRTVGNRTPAGCRKLNINSHFNTDPLKARGNMNWHATITRTCGLRAKGTAKQQAKKNKQTKTQRNAARKKAAAKRKGGKGSFKNLPGAKPKKGNTWRQNLRILERQLKGRVKGGRDCTKAKNKRTCKARNKKLLSKSAYDRRLIIAGPLARIVGDVVGMIAGKAPPKIPTEGALMKRTTKNGKASWKDFQKSGVHNTGSPFIDDYPRGARKKLIAAKKARLKSKKKKK